MYNLRFSNQLIREELFEKVVGRMQNAEDLRDKPLYVCGYASCLVTGELPEDHACVQLLREVQIADSLRYLWQKELVIVL